MTDKEFITYLGVKLLNSSEDCCSICAYCPREGNCANCDNKIPDDNICIDGIRKFAEKGEGV